MRASRAGPGPSGNVVITGGTSQWSSGTKTAPSIAFAAEPGTGLYWRTSNTLSVAAAGGEIAQFTTGRAAFLISIGLASADLSVTSPDITLSRQAAGVLCLNNATATPAGGSASMALVFGSTTGFGIYIGSGVPTVSAAQGSIYLRSDGSSTSTRLYVNTSGSTTWTNVTTAA